MSAGSNVDGTADTSSATVESYTGARPVPRGKGADSKHGYVLRRWRAVSKPDNAERSRRIDLARGNGLGNEKAIEDGIADAPKLIRYTAEDADKFFGTRQEIGTHCVDRTERLHGHLRRCGEAVPSKDLARQRRRSTAFAARMADSSWPTVAAFDPAVRKRPQVWP